MANFRGSRTQLRVNCPDIVSDIDALEPVQSQYAASPRILALLVKKAALLDPGKDLMLWYEGIFNPKSALGVGLDIWGRIVGAWRTIDLEDKRWLGFAQALLFPFDQAPMWAGKKSYEAKDLDDIGFRRLIFWKAAANIASAEAPALNELMQRLFPGLPASVIEIGVMHIRVVTGFSLSDAEEAIFRKHGLMAKGAGVGVSWLQVPGDFLGFKHSGLMPFDQAPFYSGVVLNDHPVAWLPAEMPRIGFSEGFAPFNQSTFWAGMILGEHV